jgi:CheY-like chemotaxis protein
MRQLLESLQALTEKLAGTAAAPDDGRTGAAPAAPAPAIGSVAAPGDAGGPRILIVDDTPSQRGLAAAYVAKAGYATTTAESGAAAVALAAEGGIGLVLMDLKMPGLDGLAATRLIRALPPPAGEVPIVALTADATEADRKRCLATGMTGFLTKPIDREALLAAVEAALAGLDLSGRDAA